jgi:endonuclease G, mitochondrial
MFRNRHSSSKDNYHRRGFRLRGNVLMLLFGFFLVGLFLHYGGKTQPVVAFWNDVRQLLGIKHSRNTASDRNPYKVPEPNQPNSDVATDDRTDNRNGSRRGNRPADDTEASDDNSASDRRSETTDERVSRSGNVRFDFEKQPNFLLPTSRNDGQLIQHEGYSLHYREAYEQPDWVAYPLLETNLEGPGDRKGEQFRPIRWSKPAPPPPPIMPAPATTGGIWPPPGTSNIRSG